MTICTIGSYNLYEKSTLNVVSKHCLLLSLMLLENRGLLCGKSLWIMLFDLHWLFTLIIIYHSAWQAILLSVGEMEVSVFLHLPRGGVTVHPSTWRVQRILHVIINSTIFWPHGARLTFKRVIFGHLRMCESFVFNRCFHEHCPWNPHTRLNAEMRLASAIQLRAYTCIL